MFIILATNYINHHITTKIVSALN